MFRLVIESSTKICRPKTVFDRGAESCSRKGEQIQKRARNATPNALEIPAQPSRICIAVAAAATPLPHNYVAAHHYGTSSRRAPDDVPSICRARIGPFRPPGGWLRASIGG